MAAAFAADEAWSPADAADSWGREEASIWRYWIERDDTHVDLRRLESSSRETDGGGRYGRGRCTRGRRSGDVVPAIKVSQNIRAIEWNRTDREEYDDCPWFQTLAAFLLASIAAELTLAEA